MRLADYMQQRSLSPEQLAEELGRRGYVREKTGKPVTANGIKMMLGRKTEVEISQPWLDALEREPVADYEPPPAPGREAEQTPRAPEDAKLQPAVLGLQSSKRIAGLYRFLGGLLAEGAGSPGVAVVWDQSADPIAEIWVRAAADNPWASRFVNLVNAGGPAGDLAMAHAYLLGASLYVLGAQFPAGDQLFAKYRGYRPVVQQPPEPEEPEHGDPGSNGAAATAAEARVV